MCYNSTSSGVYLNKSFFSLLSGGLGLKLSSKLTLGLQLNINRKHKQILNQPVERSFVTVSMLNAILGVGIEPASTQTSRTMGNGCLQMKSIIT